MSASGVQIRPLGDSDRAAWERLWQGYLEFYRQALSADVTERTWSRLMDPLVDVHGICATGSEGEPVGICHYIFHPITWSVAPSCYLEDLYVDAAVRGQGAGRALIESVYAAADARGAARVYWLTENDNDTARRLYDRMANLTPFVQYRR